MKKIQRKSRQSYTHERKTKERNGFESWSFCTAKIYSNIKKYICSRAEGVTYASHVNDEVRFRVYSNGDVRWIKPIPITTSCDVNIARFPFDSQTCHIEIAFWAWNGVDMIGNISNKVNY